MKVSGISFVQGKWFDVYEVKASGTDRTGRRSARDAMTGRRGERIAIRRIGTEGR